MKKITLFIALLTISLGFAQDLPYDFETSPVTADFTSFNGGAATVEAVAAPQSTGNTSTNLLKIVRNGGETWGGAFTETPSNLDFSTKKYITAKIWTNAPVGTKIMFKTEDKTDAAVNSGEKNTTTTKTGEWETIVFDFTGVTAANQNKLVLIPNNGVLGDGSATSTYYFDDIVQSETDPNTDGGGGGSTKPVFPLDFETSPVQADTEGFNGGTVTVEAVAAPQSTGNSSNNLVKLVRNGGETWAGAAIELENNLDFSAKKYITARIWTSAPIGTKVMFKTENAADEGENSGEINVNTTKSGEWETLVFDMTTGTNENTNQNKLVFIPNNGVLGDGSATSTYYFDDFQNTNVLSVDRNNLLNVSLSPSPAKNTLRISAQNTIERASIYNVLGKQVQQATINSKSGNIDVSSLSTGVYILKYSSNNTVGSMKFIKE